MRLSRSPRRPPHPALHGGAPYRHALLKSLGTFSDPLLPSWLLLLLFGMPLLPIRAAKRPPDPMRLPLSESSQAVSDVRCLLNPLLPPHTSYKLQTSSRCLQLVCLSLWSIGSAVVVAKPSGVKLCAEVSSHRLNFWKRSRTIY